MTRLHGSLRENLSHWTLSQLQPRPFPLNSPGHHDRIELSVPSIQDIEMRFQLRLPTWRSHFHVSPPIPPWAEKSSETVGKLEDEFAGQLKALPRPSYISEVQWRDAMSDAMDNVTIRAYTQFKLKCRHPDRPGPGSYETFAPELIDCYNLPYHGLTDFQTNGWSKKAEVLDKSSAWQASHIPPRFKVLSDDNVVVFDSKDHTRASDLITVHGLFGSRWPLHTRQC